MKLVRYGQPGAERPGVLDAQGVLRDLSMLLPELGPAQLAPRTLSALAALDASRLPAVQGAPRLACPVAGVGKMRMDEVTRGVMPFMMAEFTVMFLMVIFPSIVLVPMRWFIG